MGRPWLKLWSEKLMGSPRVRALKPFDYAIYMHLVVAAAEDGALKSGSHVWTWQDIALEANAPRSGKRVRAALQRLLRDGLLEARQADGAYVVANYASLQRPERRRARRPRPPHSSGGGGPRPLLPVAEGGA